MIIDILSQPEISPALLKKLAGPRAYERGVDYYNNGHVEELTIDGDKVWAEVSGTEDYRVDLVYNQRGLTGGCDCPASEGIDFCKHCVAAALALKAELQNQAKKRSTEKPLKKSAKPADIITQWLQQQDKNEVIRHFVAVVTNDRALKKEWLLKAEKGLGRLDKGAIKKQITSAFPINKHIYEYPKVRAYFASAFTVMKELESPIRQLSADEQIMLIEYGFERLSQSLETVDDSGGFRYDCLDILQGLFIEAITRLECSEETRTKKLLTIALTDQYGLHGRIPSDYEELITPECLELFYQEAQQQWDVLPPLSDSSSTKLSNYYCLESLLSDQAIRNNDYHALIAIQEKVAQHGHDYLKLAELYFAIHSYEQAQQYLNKACESDSRFRDQGHELQIKLYQATNRGNDAVLSQWQYFQRCTSLSAFQNLLEIARQENNKTDWKEQSVAWLWDNLEQKESYNHYYSSHSPRSDTLIEIYMLDKTWDKAWQVVEGFRVSDHLHLELARESGKISLNDYWSHIFPAFKKLAINEIEQGNNKAYNNAVSILVELLQLVVGTPYLQEAKEGIAELAETYKRKRNFVSYLNAAVK